MELEKSSIKFDVSFMDAPTEIHLEEPLMAVEDNENAFKFNDSFMNALTEIALEPLKVNGNSASTTLKWSDFQGKLAIGESFRLPPFTVVQTEYPWLAECRFELRIYPCGQFASNSGRCIVYLVLVECPHNYRHQQLPAAVDITVSLTEAARGRRRTDADAVVAKLTKQFDWSVKQDRWIKMDFAKRNNKKAMELVMLSVSIHVASAAPVEVMSKKKKQKNCVNKKKSKNKCK